MCIVKCDSCPYREDRSNTYLTWENGRYVPAAPMVFVPGLRQIIRRQDRQRDWDYYMNGGPPTPMHYPSGHVLGDFQGPLYLDPPHFTTTQAANRHAMLNQPTQVAYRGFGGDSVQDNTVEELSFTSDKDCNEVPISLQGSTSSSDIAANKFLSPHNSSAQNETSEPEITHSTHDTGESIDTQPELQRPQPTRTSARRPLSEFSTTAGQNWTRSVPSARPVKRPDPLYAALYGRTMLARSRQKPAAETKPLKSILKQQPTSSSSPTQTKPQRKKSVSFSLSTEDDANNQPTRAVAAKTGRTSPPPRSPSPPASSSAGRLSAEYIARKAKSAKSKANRAMRRTNHMKAEARPLTKDNLTMHSESGRGGKAMRWTWIVDGSETASNTDWELAERMKRRWI